MKTSGDAKDLKGKKTEKAADPNQRSTVPLEPCSGPQAAEVARLEAEDEACDDGSK